jgi:hypothetical protein
MSSRIELLAESGQACHREEVYIQGKDVKVRVSPETSMKE